MWYTYILKCKDNTLYTGVTTDTERRVGEHNDSKLGAKYTRSRRPVKLVYKKGFRTKIKAMQEEWRIKKLQRKDKLSLIKTKKQTNKH